jgi:predicted aspartyl protease
MATFQLDPKAPILLVDAELHGPKEIHTIRLLLDTGATYTLIKPQVLVHAGYDLATVTQRGRITTASTEEYVPFVRLIGLKALGQHIDNLTVCAHALPAGIPAEGLLGLNFLRHFNVHLNFLKGHLEISN